jgi:UDP-glucose 4-epimerase
VKVVVTGGAGQLGTVILRRLVRERSVREIVSLDVRPPVVASGKVSHVIADVRDPSIEELFRGADAVLHLAFVVTRLMDRDAFESINVGGSRNVFERAYAAGVRQFVYASSVAAYGVVDRTDLVTEDTPRVRDPSFAYAACKYDVEAFLDEWEAAHPEVTVARMRPSVLMGARIEHNLGVALRYRTIPALPRPVPMVWDEDVADAFALALKARARGGFNLTCDEPLDGAGLARAGHLRLVPLPEGAIRTTMALSDFLSERGVGIDPAWVRAITKDLAPYDTRRAREVLGWKPMCPRGEDVIRRFVELAPGPMDPRLRLLFRTVDLVARRSKPIPDLQHTVADVHLWLLGPGGGDVAFHIRDGRIRVTFGAPRPTGSVAIIKTSHFLDLLAGRTDFSVAQVTGKLRVEGEATAAFLVGGLVAQLKKQKESAAGLASRAGSLFSRWLSNARESRTP